MGEAVTGGQGNVSTNISAEMDWENGIGENNDNGGDCNVEDNSV